MARSKSRPSLVSQPQWDQELSRAGNTFAAAGTAMQNLKVLLDHYQIDRNDEAKWFMLSLKLAADRFPSGFVPKPPRNPQGRKPTKQVDDFILCGELGAAELSGKSVRNAARLLTVNHKRFKGQNPETLRQRYIHLRDKPATAEGKRLRKLISMMGGEK